MEDDELENQPGTGEPAIEQETEKDSDAELLAAVSDAIDAESEAPTEKPADEAAPKADDADAPKPTEKPAAEKPGDQPKPDDAKKPEPDPVNDPIPDEIKGRTRERMEALVARVKDATGQLEQVRGNHEELMGMISATQASPEQFGTVLDYLGAVNSGNPDQIRGAMKILQDEVAALSNMLGEPAPGVDLLANHQDLKDAVETGDMSEAHANELAAARNTRAMAESRSQQQNEQTQQTQAQQQALTQGKADLNALETELRAKDPDYDRKRAALIETLKPVMARLNPKDWAATFKEAYEAVKLPATAPAAPAAPASGQQPLRARTPAGGTQQAPGSLLDAVSAGIDQAGR